MSKIQEANRKIEEAVVGGCKKVEGEMIDAFFAEPGESTGEARARLAKGAENGGREKA